MINNLIIQVFGRWTAGITCCLIMLGEGFVPVSAQEFYVSSDGQQSDDGNPGTRAAPFRTISAAAKRAKPGDVVTVAPGLYREAVALTVSGVQGLPIIFQSEIPHQAVISGADLLEHPRQHGPGVYSYPISDPGRCSYRGGNPQWVYLDGSPLERTESHDRLIPGSFFQDCDNKRVYVALPEGKVLDGVRIEYACRDGLMATDRPLDDIHIRGFSLVHTANWFRGKGPIRITGRRWVVEGNHIKWTSYGGVIVSDSIGCIIRDNIIEWAGCQGIGGDYNADLLIEGNIVQYNNWRCFEWGNEGGGSKFVFSLDARHIGNDYSYNFGPGLWSDSGCTGTIYQKNICHDNAVRSLFSEINWDEVMQDNVVYNTGESGLHISHSSGLLVRRNVSFNNGIGLVIEGRYTRQNDHKEEWGPRAVARIGKIPGLTAQRATLWEAGFIKYFVAPNAMMTNNNVIRDNIMFDNCRTMMEGRDYRTVSPSDAFVNNFSDRNIYWAKAEKSLFNFGYSFQYDSLESWRRVSGRDEGSVFANPQDRATAIPSWAQASRSDWDLGMRSITEVDGLRDDGVRQRLFPSPMAQIAMGRMLRSPVLQAVQFTDKRVKGSILSIAGQRSLALWTSHPSERCYLRLMLGQSRISMENGYLDVRDVDLPGGAADLLVTYNPLYLRGIGDSIRESTSGIVRTRAFNLVGQAVPATASFTNESGEAALLKARFAASDGFEVQPALFEKRLSAGEKSEVVLSMIPTGVVRRGTGMLRMDATVGVETIHRAAVFTVGEGNGKLPKAPAVISVDGQLGDWGSVVEKGIPLATLSDANQVFDGSGDVWRGPQDLSARLHSAWSEKSLYLAIVVQDDKVITASEAEVVSGPASAIVAQCDAVEVSLDARAPDMQWQQEVNKGCMDVLVSPMSAGSKAITSMNGKTKLSGLAVAAVRTPAGYTVEMEVPLSEANFPAGQWEQGRPVRLSLIVFDADGSKANAKRKSIGWKVSPQQRNNEDASGWGTVILDAESAGKE